MCRGLPQSEDILSFEGLDLPPDVGTIRFMACGLEHSVVLSGQLHLSPSSTLKRILLALKRILLALKRIESRSVA